MNIISGSLRLLVLTGFTMLFVQAATAQEEEAEADTVVYPVWETNLAARLSGSQAGYRNWTEGGINTLVGTSQLDGTFNRRSESWLQAYETRMAIGIVKQDTLAVRKAEDILRIKGQVSYRGDSAFNIFSPTAAAGLRTQFAPGFNYDRNPLDDGQDLPVKVSDVFSPATFTQSLGFAYNNSSVGFRQRVGMAAKETVVLIERLRMLYGHEAAEAVRFQLGVESQTELDREVFDNVHVKSSLGLFAAFNQEELPDVLWENQVILQINAWLSADFEVTALYDRDIGDVVQIKEVVSIALSIVFI